MRYQCERCGHWNEVDVSLSQRQADALDAVRHIARRDRRRAASTLAVSVVLGVCPRAARMHLHSLELLGMVARRGRRGGWRPVEEMAVLPLAIERPIEVAA